MSEIQDAGNKRIVFGSKIRKENLSDKVIGSPFPSERSLYWVPKNADSDESSNPDEPSLPALMITQEVLVAVNQHVSETLKCELGGFLLGNRYKCPISGREYVIIDQYSKAQFTEATSVSLSFTPEAWAQLNDEMTGKFLGKLVVGWYHSHPRLEIFLSSYDMELHKQRFPDPWMPALVLEPEKQLGGFFAWRNGRINPRVPVGFYEYLQGENADSKESVLAWANYSCRNPMTGKEISLNRSPAQAVQQQNGANDATTNGRPSDGVARWTLSPANRLKQLRPGLVAATISLIVLVLAAFGPLRPLITNLTGGGKTLKVEQFSYEIDRREDALKITIKLENSPENLLVKINGQEARVKNTWVSENIREIQALVSVQKELEEMLTASYPINVELSDGSSQGRQLTFFTDPDVVSRGGEKTVPKEDLEETPPGKPVVAKGQTSGSTQGKEKKTHSIPQAGQTNQTSSANTAGSQQTSGQSVVQNTTGATTNQGEAATRQSGATSSTSPSGAATNQSGATTSPSAVTTNQSGAATNQGGAATSPTSPSGAATNQSGATTGKQTTGQKQDAQSSPPSHKPGPKEEKEDKNLLEKGFDTVKGWFGKDKKSKNENKNKPREDH